MRLYMYIHINTQLFLFSYMSTHETTVFVVISLAHARTRKHTRNSPCCPDNTSSCLFPVSVLTCIQHTHTCIYICIYVYVSICICINKFTHICMYIYTHVYISAYIDLDRRTLLHTCKRMWTLKYTLCHTLLQTATHCYKLPHTATNCHTLQHTATHCTILHHTGPYYNTLQHMQHTDI